MLQNNISKKIELLENNLKKLIIEYKHIKTELNELKIENDNLKSYSEKQNKKLKDFQYQGKIHSIVTNITAANKNTKNLKLKINEYIKEIDRCIVSLTEDELDTVM